MGPRLAVIVVALGACGDDLRPPPSFAKDTLDGEFRAEGVAIFDVDHDGDADVVTDQFWYAGPTWAPHEIRAPEVFDPHGYSKSVSAWGDDIDGDGWTDLVVAPFPTDAMYWYRNPEGGEGHWTPNLVAPPLSAGMEQPIYVDLFGDGRRVAIMGVEPQLAIAWFEPTADPRAPWRLHPISPNGFGAAYRFFHGLGIGDVDGDGKSDVLTSVGWFQQTADRDAWVFHAHDFGPLQCSTMFAHDVDGDGHADVLCAHPHAYGLSWWRQVGATFEEHVIDDSISQLGALGMDDLDGDGTPELVTGKNWWAHPAGDPGTDDPVVLSYFVLGDQIERHDIDDDSGIGRQVTIGDVSGDGKPDIVESTKRGLFLFTQR